MLTVVLAWCIALLLIYRAYKYVTFRPSNFPPGPPRIPLFGSYLFMLMLNHRHLDKAVQFFTKWYKSNIIGLHLGSMPTIILNDTEQVKKALYHRDFDGRPDLLLARLREPRHRRLGIFFVDGELWHGQRRFALRYLRDFGFGRRFQTLEIEIQDEMRSLMDMLKYGPKYEHEHDYVKDGCLLVPLGLSPFFANCFTAVLFNQRLGRSELRELYEASDQALQFQRQGDNFGRLFSIIEWVAKLFPKTSEYEDIEKSSMKLYSFFKELVDKEIQTYDASHERHFIDMYLTKMKEEEVELGENASFTYDQLIMICTDFAFPPLSALSVTIAFLFQQIYIEPDVQKKIQMEIDSVVGNGRLPTLDDRINLSYTEACVREIMRFETLVTPGLMHKAMVDTKFLNYDIPKGCLVMPGLAAAAHDNTWDSPFTFKPERFLDVHGKLDLTKDHSMPFGAGKRLCAGETFARNMLFLLTAGLFQNFNISAPPGSTIPNFEQNATGLVRSPPDFWVKLTAR